MCDCDPLDDVPCNSRRQLERRRPTSITLPFAIIKDSAAASHSRQSGKKPICFLDGRLCCVCCAASSLRRVLLRRLPQSSWSKERTDLCVCDRYDGINSPQSDKRIFRWKKKNKKTIKNCWADLFILNCLLSTPICICDDDGNNICWNDEQPSWFCRRSWEYVMRDFPCRRRSRSS